MVSSGKRLWTVFICLSLSEESSSILRISAVIAVQCFCFPLPNEVKVEGNEFDFVIVRNQLSCRMSIYLSLVLVLTPTAIFNAG